MVIRTYQPVLTALRGPVRQVELGAKAYNTEINTKTNSMHL